MSLKSKILNAITAHPKLVVLGIGLGITFAVSTALGLINPEQVFAPGGVCNWCM